MNNFSYVGPFKIHIENHLKLKRAVGYKHNADASRLKCFDQFTLEKYPQAVILTKEIVLDWCRKKIYETQANQNVRASAIRQFGKYIDSIGINAYILPKGYYPNAKRYVPYIYTVEELAKFFSETDQCRYCYECPYRHLIMPVIFRMIYMCGLRLSEARLLKVADVDLKNGVLTIHQSKKDNSRLVPMSAFLTKLCRNFSKKVHLNSTENNYCFPALNGKPMTMVNVYHNFRRFLWRAGISHGGKGCGPRIHDFRHAYAVHCLKKWAEQGKDLAVYLPILKTYMGHDSFNETAYYLRLTADVFPHITLKIETQYPGIIPTLEGEVYETY
jgi:integrase/recombinase XerD